MIIGQKDIAKWPVAPARVELRKEEVQVWRGSQYQPAARIEAFLKTLSAGERARGERFRFEQDRLHFVAAHGILRQLLGSFLETTPDRVQFQYSKYGKPSLAEKFESSRLKFNMSHSGGTVLLGFTIERELGVDIERVRRDFATEEIAERFFSAYEVGKLRSLPKSIQAEAFFNCWTRKEAYIKAIGEGLSCPLDKFDVTLAPGEAARLLATRVRGLSASKWVMWSLDAGEDYKAAVVAEGEQSALRCWQWDS